MPNLDPTDLGPVPVHDKHGSTPAAWTAVVVIILGFVVGTVSLTAGNWVTFALGVALVPLGAIIGAVMSKAGLGKDRNEAPVSSPPT